MQRRSRLCFHRHSALPRPTSAHCWPGLHRVILQNPKEQFRASSTPRMGLHSASPGLQRHCGSAPGSLGVPQPASPQSVASTQFPSSSQRCTLSSTHCTAPGSQARMMATHCPSVHVSFRLQVTGSLHRPSTHSRHALGLSAVHSRRPSRQNRTLGTHAPSP